MTCLRMLRLCAPRNTLAAERNESEEGQTVERYYELWMTGRDGK